MLAITDRRVLVVRSEQAAAIPLTDVHTVDISRPAGRFVVTAAPGIKTSFAMEPPAMRFAALLEPRDVPELYPDFYRSILAEVGLPDTSTNRIRLQEMVSRQITAGGAFAYFDQLGDREGRRLFSEFFQGTEDLNALADDMIDWLWERNWRLHEPLRGLVPKIRSILTEPGSPLRTYDGEIPESQW